MNLRLLGAPTLKDVVPAMVDTTSLKSHIVAVPQDSLYYTNCELDLWIHSDAAEVISNCDRRRVFAWSTPARDCRKVVVDSRDHEFLQTFPCSNCTQLQRSSQSQGITYVTTPKSVRLPGLVAHYMAHNYNGKSAFSITFFEHTHSPVQCSRPEPCCHWPNRSSPSVNTHLCSPSSPGTGLPAGAEAFPRMSAWGTSRSSIVLRICSRSGEPRKSDSFGVRKASAGALLQK